MVLSVDLVANINLPVQRGVTLTYVPVRDCYLKKTPPNERALAEKKVQFLKAACAGSDVIDAYHAKFNTESQVCLRACYTCGVAEDALEDHQSLRCCSACRKAGRAVWYCSE